VDVLPGEKDKREKGLSLSVFAGQAVALTAAALRDNILEYASRHTGVPTSDCRLDDDAVICGNRRIPLSELHAAGIRARHRFEARRKAYLSPLTVAFNAHGVRVAVNRITAEIRVLHSVHAADIGRLLNPMQCRGQIDGAIAMGFGWTLCENMVHDASGAIVNPPCAIPDPCLCRRAAQRSVFLRHFRPDWAARRQVSGRVRYQPGRSGNSQCCC